MRYRASQESDEALETVDLEHVLGSEGLAYKATWGRSGKQLNLRTCPFCGNNKSKVYINADTGLGNCFAGSCTQGTFNKWQLLKEIYQLGYGDLKAKINQLAADQGWRPMKQAVARFDPGELELPNNVKIKDLPAMPRYLLDRGIDGPLADYFDLRWSEKGTFIIKGPDGKPIMQDYSQRILIPIYDLDGNMVSFQGRDATGKSEKRYLFPPLFSSTGSHLYNINNWRDGMSSLVISEGPFDVIGVKRALDTINAERVLPVGSFGMTLSISKSGHEDQMGKLLALKARGLKTVMFLWDNEPVALQRAVDAAVEVLRYGFKVRVAKLSRSKDPGDASPEEIVEAMVTAAPINSALSAMMVARHFAQS